MMPLNLKTAPQRIGERAGGCLVLLLVLFLLHLLKPAPYRFGADVPPCRSPVHVEIHGDVRSPGVYRFCEPPSLRALILKAGGLRGGDSPVGDQPLAPNTAVAVTREGPEVGIQKQEIPSFYKITLGIPVSLNTESEEGLTALPGIGETIAKAIVEERARRGGFKTLDEAVGIPGLGPKLYRKIKPYLTL